MSRRFMAAAAAVTMSGSLALGLATPAMAAPASAPANVSKSEFIAGIEEISPSLRDQFTDRQLVKLGKSYCKALKAGSSIKRVDKITRKYLTDDESMVLVGLSVAAFCDQHWSKVSRFYGLDD